MSGLVRRRVVALVVVLSMLAVPARPARADDIKNKVVGAAVGIIAGVVVLTVVVVLLVKKHPSATGCLAQAPDGLRLLNESDQTNYLLVGDTTGLVAGDRVKVQGKKAGPTGAKRLVVDKLKKDFGVCKVGTP